MITFYADSTKEAYQKMQSDEWKEAIQEYISGLNGFVNGQVLDKHNLLLLFELDAYDVYVTWEDVSQQNSRLAGAFRRCILEQYEEMKKDKTEVSRYEQKVLKKSFAQNLRKLRISKHLTQDSLAKMSNIPLNTLINYENQRRFPTGRNLCILAKFFNVDPIDLLGTDIN